jgi:hypothetical protein
MEKVFNLPYCPSSIYQNCVSKIGGIMKELEPGHVYDLQTLDVPVEVEGEFNQYFEGSSQELIFVKRVGEKYPGNEGEPHPGTTVQEVCRGIIARLKYVNNQEFHAVNVSCINYARIIILQLEERAAERHGFRLPESLRTWVGASVLPEVETWLTCEGCGHIVCEKYQRGRSSNE